MKKDKTKKIIGSKKIEKKQMKKIRGGDYYTPRSSYYGFAYASYP